MYDHANGGGSGNGKENRQDNCQDQYYEVKRVQAVLAGMRQAEGCINQRLEAAAVKALDEAGRYCPLLLTIFMVTLHEYFMKWPTVRKLTLLKNASISKGKALDTLIRYRMNPDQLAAFQNEVEKQAAEACIALPDWLVEAFQFRADNPHMLGKSDLVYAETEGLGFFHPVIPEEIAADQTDQE